MEVLMSPGLQDDGTVRRGMHVHELGLPHEHQEWLYADKDHAILQLTSRGRQPSNSHLILMPRKKYTKNS